MSVPPASEWTALHLVHEPVRPLQLDDPGGEPLSESEMCTFNRVYVSELEQAGGLAWFDQTLVGKRGAFDVRTEIARKVETKLDWRVDSRLNGDRGHLITGCALS